MSATTRTPLMEIAGAGGKRLRGIDLAALLADRSTPLPRALMIVLENVARQRLRGAPVEAEMAAVAGWTAASPELSVPLKVTRVMFPDSSGLPALMDLAAARDRVAAAGGDPRVVEPDVPVTLVVDHSLIVDVAGRPDAEARNIEAEYRRNGERYAFFKWARQAFDKLRIVPPGAGIIHQVHLERLARVVATETIDGIGEVAAPEFVLGCDSHTPMVNGLGLLAWGVGGIDAEAAALGQEYQVRIPRVVGVRLVGALAAGATTTDLVLTVTQRLRDVGVTGAFVEFFGPGLPALSVPDRATIANMAPEYGATVGYFPIDARTIDYLVQSGREPEHVALVEAYARAAGLFAEPGDAEPEVSETVEIDLSAIGPSIAGPRRPQDRLRLADAKSAFRAALHRSVEDGGFGVPREEGDRTVEVTLDGRTVTLGHGVVPVAAITSCTNTSNPSVMIGAGLLARNARRRGLQVPPWVKTSLAPGSRLVRDYLGEAGLLAPLEELGFHIVGFGCTTCSGKSGPIAPEIAAAIADNDLVAAAVLSGNRNFEGRIHRSCRASYLASPPLVVAFALAGRVDIDVESEPLGHDAEGRPVLLADIWPDRDELTALVAESQRPERFRKSYATLFDGSKLWEALPAATGPTFAWGEASTYIRRPPFFELAGAGPDDRIADARVLVKVGDSLTTDHITPSGEILPDSQAGRYLMEAGVEPKAFNAVTQRRGNHEFMARVTFANQRMKNQLVPGTEGGFTRTEPDGPVVTIHDAAARYRDAGTPMLVLAGRDYGMGSSRDWAAKGPKLLGVELVLAVSFERIHRANLIGMGILPLTFADGADARSLGLTGFERFTFEGLREALRTGSPVAVTARAPDGGRTTFAAAIDVASDHERRLLAAGGIFSRLLARFEDAA
ncbi:aconitate hydratase AcnA [Aquibium sp. A9E412]|uniref:aconitate hydratase AcnA n=1 Tax=Aquibium sp. A9E412 TaxID=2976767 RepID=UPI0025B08BFC|nr:aconitate hydratase AcnA [Aquibium sp. A9E412]MDN2566526.1 aconitate hydratase AcnA [Aquibium sp. A9E412]